MARFIGRIESGRKPLERIGRTYLTVFAHGWDYGVRVGLRVENDCNKVEIWLDGGSNGERDVVLLAEFTEDEVRKILSGEYTVSAGIGTGTTLPPNP